MECDCGEQCLRISDLVKEHFNFSTPQGHPEALALRGALKEVRDGSALTAGTPYGVLLTAVVTDGWTNRADGALNASWRLEGKEKLG